MQDSKVIPTKESQIPMPLESCIMCGKTMANCIAGRYHNLHSCHINHNYRNYFSSIPRYIFSYVIALLPQKSHLASSFGITERTKEYQPKRNSLTYLNCLLSLVIIIVQLQVFTFTFVSKSFVRIGSTVIDGQTFFDDSRAQLSSTTYGEKRL